MVNLYKNYIELANTHVENLSCLRIGQLFENIRAKYGDLFYVPDDKLLEYVKEFAEKCKSE